METHDAEALGLRGNRIGAPVAVATNARSEDLIGALAQRLALPVTYLDDKTADVLLRYRTPPCAAVYFFFGRRREANAPLLRYYTKRLMNLFVQGRMESNCTLVIADPEEDAKLFAQMGYASHDIFRTTEDIRRSQLEPRGAHVSSGKTRDNLLVLIGGGYARYHYALPTFNIEAIGKMFTFILQTHSPGHAPAHISLPSALVLVSRSEIIGPLDDPSQTSFDEFEAAVLTDLFRHSLVLLHNASNSSSATRAFSSLAHLLRDEEKLQIVSLDFDRNDIPAIFFFALPLKHEPLEPALFAVAASVKPRLAHLWRQLLRPSAGGSGSGLRSIPRPVTDMERKPFQECSTLISPFNPRQGWTVTALKQFVAKTLEISLEANRVTQSHAAEL
jgi:hypothetical protein